MRGDGRIFTRDNSPYLWVSFYRGGKEIRESTGLDKTNPKSQKQAEKFLRDRCHDVREEHRGGRPFVGPREQRVTVGQLLDDLEESYKAREIASPQFSSHLKRIRQTFGFWRAMHLVAQPGAIDRYINDCRTQDMAPATINRGTQLLGQAFKLGVENKRVAAMPVIRHLPEKNRRRGFFEDADFNAVVDALPDYLKDFARFGYTTGWRKGEIASLLWADVDENNIRLRPEHSKNDEPRSVPLVEDDGQPSDVGEIIDRRRAARVVKTMNGDQLASHVFHHYGLPIGDMRKAWRTALRKVGLVGMLFHDLRRTAVRNMVRAGVPERVAMEISGHRTRSVFDRYNIVNERDKAEALRRTREYRATTKARSVAVMKASGS